MQFVDFQWILAFSVLVFVKAESADAFSKALGCKTSAMLVSIGGVMSTKLLRIFPSSDDLTKCKESRPCPVFLFSIKFWFISSFVILQFADCFSAFAVVIHFADCFSAFAVVRQFADCFSAFAIVIHFADCFSAFAVVIYLADCFRAFAIVIHFADCFSAFAVVIHFEDCFSPFAVVKHFADCFSALAVVIYFADCFSAFGIIIHFADCFSAFAIVIHFADCLRNKFQFLEKDVCAKLDILRISETKLDYSFPSAQFLLDGFSKSYRLDRYSNGGAILLYIRDDIPSRLLSISNK